MGNEESAAVCFNGTDSSICVWGEYVMITNNPKVCMPSGQLELISTFVPTSPSVILFRLIELKSKMGQEGQREHDIVCREMMNSVLSHIRCNVGGGCFNTYDIIAVEKFANTIIWNKYSRRKAAIMVENGGDANEMMLFHGTPAVGAVLLLGFDETKANPNGLFGAAMYFAEHSSKSNQYVFGYMGGHGCEQHHDKNCHVCSRIMLLCRVALGKVYKVKKPIKCLPNGYHSVKGIPSSRGLRYPEYAIYHGDQVYPEYVIRYRIRD